MIPLLTQVDYHQWVVSNPQAYLACVNGTPPHDLIIHRANCRYMVPYAYWTTAMNYVSPKRLKYGGQTKNALAQSVINSHSIASYRVCSHCKP